MGHFREQLLSAKSPPTLSLTRKRAIPSSYSSGLYLTPLPFHFKSILASVQSSVPSLSLCIHHHQSSWTAPAFYFTISNDSSAIRNTLQPESIHSKPFQPATIISLPVRFPPGQIAPTLFYFNHSCFPFCEPFFTCLVSPSNRHF